MTLPTIHAAGNLTRDPELKITSKGSALTRLSVACNQRRYNKDTQQWEDGDATYLDVVAFGDLANNVAESLVKGDAVIIVGQLTSSSWETQDGDKRTRLEVRADNIGPDLRRATAKVTRIGRTSTPSATTPATSTPADDPWATNAEIPF